MCNIRLVRHLMVFLLIVLMLPQAWAFNTHNCSSLFPNFGSQKPHPPYFSIFFITTMIPSTTSYFSSIGKCAMYGEKSIKAMRIEFAKNSQENIELNISRGEGQYLKALAFLSGCPNSVHSQFAQTMKGHYTDIFSAKEPDAEVILNRIDNHIQSDQVLKKRCDYTAI